MQRLASAIRNASGWPWSAGWIALSILVLAVALELLMDPDPQRLHLGAEYYNVALALADGRGFSDPFAERTGPTAWMPPVYPVLMAGLILVLGTKNQVASAMAVLMIASLIVQAVTVHAIARRLGRHVRPAVAVVLYVIWTLTFYYWFFLLTSDVWILSLLVSLLTLATVHHRTVEKLPWWVWGVLGGTMAMTSPTLGFAWGCLAILLFLIEKPERRRWVYSVALAVAIVTPWVARNVATFDKVIGTKSNLMFEAYQANVADRDGVYDVSSMLAHPYNSPDMRFEYGQLGEIAFIDEYGRRFRAALDANPTAVLSRVVNRAIAATVRYIPISENMGHPAERFVQNVVYPIPFLALIGAGWIRGPHRRTLAVLAFVWGCYLLPYVVVAFYARYFLPLTPLLVVSTFLVLDQLAGRLAIARRPPSASALQGVAAKRAA